MNNVLFRLKRAYVKSVTKDDKREYLFVLKILNY